MSSRSTRQRKEVARRKYEKYQERKRAEAARRRRCAIIVAIVVVVALLIAGTFWFVNTAGEDDEAPQTQPGEPLVYSQPQQVLDRRHPGYRDPADQQGNHRVRAEYRQGAQELELHGFPG